MPKASSRLGEVDGCWIRYAATPAIRCGNLVVRTVCKTWCYRRCQRLVDGWATAALFIDPQ